jgi:hypothetical protein
LIRIDHFQSIVVDLIQHCTLVEVIIIPTRNIIAFTREVVAYLRKGTGGAVAALDEETGRINFGGSFPVEPNFWIAQQRFRVKLTSVTLA